MDVETLYKLSKLKKKSIHFSDIFKNFVTFNEVSALITIKMIYFLKKEIKS